MVLTKTRKWGNSIGVRIPANIVDELHLKEDQEIEITINPSGNLLREMFGAGKGKTKKTTEQMIKETRKDISKFFQP